MNQKVKKPDVILNSDLKDSITIKNPGSSWYRRLWNIISNPFMYLITGKIRY